MDNNRLTYFEAYKLTKRLFREIYQEKHSKRKIMKILLRELNGLRRIGMREWSSQRGKQLRTDLARFAINSDQTKYKILWPCLNLPV